MTRSSPPRRAAALSKADYELLAEFRFLLRSFLAFSAEAAERAGLTPQQHQALLAIKGYRGKERVSVGELAERLALRHHSAVGLVDRLAAHGLVRRRSAARDRRRVAIELTERAESVLRTLSLAHRAELRRLAPVLQPLLVRLRATAPRTPRSRRER